MYAQKPEMMSYLRMDDVEWTGLNADVLMWMAGIQSSIITGTIAMAEASGDRYLTFDEKVSLVNRWGDIDSTENPIYITYSTRSINTITIHGEKDLYSLKTYDMTLKCLPVSGNNVAVEDGRPAIKFSLESAASPYAIIEDSVEGVIRVVSLSNPSLKETFLMTVTVKLMNGGTLSASHRVRFYRRVPEVGDFAWSDGTFDNQFDASKELVGIVFKREQTDTGYRLRVMSREDVPFIGSDGQRLSESMPWGLYPQEAQTEGFSETVLADVCAATGLASATDLPMTNLYGGGDWGEAGYYIKPDTYRDANEDDGYKKYTLEAVNDYEGEQKTDIIVTHANTIILNYLDESLPTTIAELVDKMKVLQDANGGDTRYRQFFYPAAYGCRLYQPSTEVLHQKYMKGRWYLPGEAELMRIFNFFLVSSGDVAGKSPSAQYANEAPQSEAATPIFANLLKRVVDGGGSSHFIMPALSSFWSATEVSSARAWYVDFGSGYANYSSKCNGFRVRAVTAFDFEL